jgi:hypothetical protein
MAGSISVALIVLAVALVGFFLFKRRKQPLGADGDERMETAEGTMTFDEEADVNELENMKRISDDGRVMAVSDDFAPEPHEGLPQL